LPGDQLEAERRAARLAELAQMGMDEMRALLDELMPSESPTSSGSSANPAQLHVLASALLEQHGLATGATRLLSVMVPVHLRLHLDFEE
jgi:hypothetical protein